MAFQQSNVPAKRPHEEDYSNVRPGSRPSNDTGSRASQACRSCRRKKLRCSGSWPCDRCRRTQQTCEFGKNETVSNRSAATDPHTRLDRLENGLSILIAGLAAPDNSLANITPTAGNPPSPVVSPISSTSQHQFSRSVAAPPTSDSTQADLPRLNVDNEEQSQDHTFTAPPRRNEPATGPEQRLDVAQGHYNSPFRPLSWNPAVWNPASTSRRVSPQPASRPPSPVATFSSENEPYVRRYGGQRDDPVSTGIVDSAMAETLLEFYVHHCHPFLPIVNVSLVNLFAAIRRSPALISAVIAVAARFYMHYAIRSPSSLPALDRTAPHRLANLAETHVAQISMRKKHALSDMQAMLIMSAWGLGVNGRGPDAWLLAGQASRVGKRLEVHKILAADAIAFKIAVPGTNAYSHLLSHMPQWRTWLSCFHFESFLALGWGRAFLCDMDPIANTILLQQRIRQPFPQPGTVESMAYHGDVYTCSQVELAHIARELAQRGERLSAEDPDLCSLSSMLSELNEKLDDWCRTWIWPGSLNSWYLGPSARIAKLPAEHLRLCLNSYALKVQPGIDLDIAQYLRKAATAAVSTIQTQNESTRTDLALGFATDYITTALAQSAMFLVRLAKAGETMMKIAGLDIAVISHYVKMTIDSLESSNLSYTRLSIHLAKTLREVSKTVNIVIPGAAMEPNYDDPSAPVSHCNSPRARTQPATEQTQQAPFDWSDFLQLGDPLDVGTLLGVPGDDMMLSSNLTMNNQSAQPETFNEFEEFQWTRMSAQDFEGF